jgi:acetolactate synthase I/II/III large subunit
VKASDLMLKCLEEQGVTHIYGVPGEENADMMISLLDSSIEFITCRHEQNAAFMADMHGRLTGRPGVCLATLGPGATNLMTGIANANMDHSPLIAIIGQADANRLHKVSHQNMDSVRMFEPVTKWAITIRDAEVIPEVIAKAVKVSVSAQPGAVLIELPEDVAKHETDAIVIEKQLSEIHSGVCTKQLIKGMDLLEASQKPIVLVGSNATYYEIDEKLLEFVDKAKLYVADTFMGKGAFSAKHPRSLRCVGLGMKDLVVEAFDQADLVICIGYDMVEWSPSHWNKGHQRKVIHIDTAPAEVDQDYMPEVELVGNLNVILREMIARLGSEHQKDPKLFATLRAKITEDLSAYDNDSGFPMKPQKILHDTRDVLRDEDVLVSDVGAHKMWVARHYPTYQSKTCFIYNGFCPMGGSMSAAIMSQWLHPEKNTVVVIGDGGFVMSIQALVTAVQYKAPITVLLWEDDHYGLIKWKQEMAFHQTSHIDLDNPDLVELSQAFGCHSERIESVDGFKPALKAALARQDKPSVLVIPVDYRENMKLYEHLGDIVSH